MTVQYWSFVLHFPHLFRLNETLSLLDEMSGIIVHFIFGVFGPLTSLL